MNQFTQANVMALAKKLRTNDFNSIRQIISAIDEATLLKLLDDEPLAAVQSHGVVLPYNPIPQFKSPQNAIEAKQISNAETDYQNAIATDWAKEMSTLYGRLRLTDKKELEKIRNSDTALYDCMVKVYLKTMKTKY